jgi:SAM-dependent methyltransferase
MGLAALVASATSTAEGDDALPVEGTAARARDVGLAAIVAVAPAWAPPVTVRAPRNATAAATMLKYRTAREGLGDDIVSPLPCGSATTRRVLKKVSAMHGTTTIRPKPTHFRVRARRRRHDNEVTALPPDYDSDPERWASHDATWLMAGDVHEMVAQRIDHGGLRPVLDKGSGQSRLGAVLPTGWPYMGIDSSSTQLRHRQGGAVVRGEASHLPFLGRTFGAVAALWMLYHLDDPIGAVAEAHRVLRPDGVFFACTSSRYNDPELVDHYPTTSFDAEEAPTVVASVFGESSTQVIRWDAPLVRLPNREALARYLRSHGLPPETIERVSPPMTLTKRGCLVLGHRVDRGQRYV